MLLFKIIILFISFASTPFININEEKWEEIEIVFLIGMNDGTFPDFRAANKGGGELRQAKNNTYVVFTRAKRFLYVTYPKKRLMPSG